MLLHASAERVERLPPPGNVRRCRARIGAVPGGDRGAGAHAHHEISWAVGYEDPAFFRRLFRRIARLTPGDYRRKFRMPELPGMGSTDS
jgi:AraC-like DNA-binding protein